MAKLTFWATQNTGPVTNNDRLVNGGGSVLAALPANGSYDTTNGLGGPKVDFLATATENIFGPSGDWNSVKLFQIAGSESLLGGKTLVLRNFVDARADFGSSKLPLDIDVEGAKRGQIATGSGNDHLSVTVSSNAAGAPFENNFIINMGSGEDTVLFGPSDPVPGFPGNDVTGLWTTIDANLGSGNDSFNSSSLVAAVTVAGGSGNDYIATGSNNDSINAGSGEDTVYGGDGDNKVIGDSGNDYIATGYGADTIDSGSGNDTVESGDGNDSVTAGSGDDRVVALGGNDTVIGGSGVDTVIGGGGNDSIVGDSGSDCLFGDGEGDSVPAGQEGNLIVNGSFEDTGGGETPQGYGASDTDIPGWILNEGTQFELVDSGHRGVASSDGARWLDMDATADNLDISQAVAGLINGASYALHFDAANYPGGNSMDVYWNGQLLGNINPAGLAMESFDFTVQGGAGDGTDTLRFVGLGPEDNVGVELDHVTLTYDTSGFGNGNDTLLGGSGNDKLFGGGGDDTLIGGLNVDLLNGGPGNDLFGFAPGDTGVGVGARDIIADFEQGADLIDLLAFGPLAFIGGGAFSGAAEVRFFQTATDTVVEINTNGDFAADAQIELTGLHTMLGTDFA